MTSENQTDLPSRRSALPKSPGRVAYGYRTTPDGKRIPAPGEAEVVRELITRVAARESLVGVVREFEARGLVGRSGKPISRVSAAAIVRNETYAGHRPEIAPALVDEETFGAAQKELDSKKRHGEGGDSGAKYLLTGIARCGECGRTLQHTTIASAGVVKDHYRCFVRGDHTIARSQAWLDNMVIDELMRMLPDAKPGQLLYDLARDPRPREVWARLPLSRRRAIILESLTVEILRVGRGKSGSAEGIRLTRRVAT
ncbi:recombinase family protein [Nocardia sp. NPDC057440]|uniref:recombinase family protein n=1 Tax=Nocardia sp. NPDC057440 TaxID=3346134 RepID=UPI003672B804